MSIADKITSIINHLTDDYVGIANLGVDLTNVDKNIENIKECLDGIYAKYPKVSNEGTLVTLSGTNKGKLGIVEKGNSTQETTTGKQLFNKNDTPASISYSSSTAIDTGVRITSINSGTGSQTRMAFFKLIDLTNYVGKVVRLKTNFIASNNTIKPFYTMGYTNADFTKRKQISGTGQSFVSGTTIYFTVNQTDVETDNKKYLMVVLYTTFGTEVNSGDYVDYTDLIVTIDNSDMSYEQYTNGPAPNPSYPFPIKSVTGNNNVVVFNGSLTEQGGINDTTGAENSATTRIKTDYVQIPNYTSMQITSNNTSLVFRAIHFYNSSKTWVSSSGYVGSALPYTVTDIPSNAKYFKVVFQGQNASLDLSPTGNYLIIGTPQTLPLNLGSIELNKIGTYQDYIYKNNGNWYKHETVGKLIFNGTDDSWQLRNTSTNGVKTYSLNSTVPDYYREENLTSPNNMAYCDKFVINRTVLGASAMYTENILLDVIGVSFYYNSENTSRALYINTTETLPSYFENNNAKFYYKKATATDIQITDTTLISQLEDIDKMQSYNGTTIITSTYESGNAQMNISGSALKGE